MGNYFKGLSAAFAGIGLCSCGLIDANIFDTTIRLSPQSYKQSFGSAGGMLAAVTGCTNDAMCTPLSSWIQGGSARCDVNAAPTECVIEAPFNLAYPLTLSEDGAFQSGVGQKAVQAVRTIKLDYQVDNRATFALPELEVYVGPAGVMSKNDTSIALIGRVPATPAAKSQTGALEVKDGTDARSKLIYAVQKPKTPLTFLVSGTLQLRSGKPQPAPAGEVEVKVTPSLVVGLPR